MSSSWSHQDGAGPFPISNPLDTPLAASATRSSNEPAYAAVALRAGRSAETTRRYGT